MDEQHNHKQKITKFKLSMLERMIMIPMSILSILLFVIFMLKMIHFMLIPIPALFSSPTLTHTPYTTPSYLFNFSIYLSFFVQHIVMALIIFKTSIVKFIPTYPLYERYIYNICSSWYYIVIL